MDHINHLRRQLVVFGTAAAGLALLPGTAFATLYSLRPRMLTLNNLHTGETLKTEFFNGKSYDQSDLSRLNHFFPRFSRQVR